MSFHFGENYEPFVSVNTWRKKDFRKKDKKKMRFRKKKQEIFNWFKNVENSCSKYENVFTNTTLFLPKNNDGFVSIRLLSQKEVTLKPQFFFANETTQDT